MVSDIVVNTIVCVCTLDMENYTVAICGILYAGTAIKFFMDGQHGFAVTYISYAMANVGLIMAAGGFK